MKNYKPFGDFIQLVDERNTALEELPLVRLSISKQFIAPCQTHEAPLIRLQRSQVSAAHGLWPQV